MTFTHLRLHTEFSLIDGLIRIPELMTCLPTRGMQAVAVTDFCNLFAVVKCYQNALKQKIKPIIGCEILWYFSDKPHQPYSLILLCQNEIGYRNLTRLISKAYLEGQHQGQPRIAFEWIALFSEGLIALSGAQEGDVGVALSQQRFDEAKTFATHWKQVFPNRYYLEIQRINKPQESDVNRQLVQLADQLNLPLVATHSVCFLNEDDFDAHEARVCIHDGMILADPKRTNRYHASQYLTSAEEMVALFHDLPHAIKNTVEITKRCSVQLTLGENYLPQFPTPNDMTMNDYLNQLSQQGLIERLQQLFSNLPSELFEKKRLIYDARLSLELQVIHSMGFSGYFLIVADFIQWAKRARIPVGPGRGSGAGSLVAYALQITDLDPLAYELLFERFLNPERVSMPDFDIDFCIFGRDRVIDYVAEKYGRDSVSQIITFGTMAAKAVIRDVGRVLGHPYGFVDKLAKLIPFELGITLTKALAQEEALRTRYESEEEVKELIDLALKLEGITRNAGKHAGGVVIAPSPLTDFSALYCEAGSTQFVSQFDKDDVESVGLVKFDFLGLKTLTIIDWAVKMIHEKQTLNQEPPIDITKIPMDDTKTFSQLKTAQTTAIFQLESRGMKELIARLKPDCFEEIIALVALFRPGPLQSGMVDDFIDRKHGKAPVIYEHPDLEPILKPTYGVILYQEQVMQIAQVLASYTLGSADLLRRAMGKKKPEEMAKQREIFTEGAKARGIETAVAVHIFDLMEKFAGYGFNKSHSAAYALIAYQTAWLKTHYPTAFMAAVLSADMDHTDKIVIFINDCKIQGLTVLPPSIHRGLYRFTVDEKNQIVYGLGAIKGVGEAAIEDIIQKRIEGGPFQDLFNFCARIDLRRVNRRVLEALIKSGACDVFEKDRAILFASLDTAIQAGLKTQQQSQMGQADFFSLIDHEKSISHYVESAAWPDITRLNGEKETLGYFLTGHPTEIYCQELKNIITPLGQLNPQHAKRATLCGLITAIRTVMTKRGKKLVIVGLEDLHTRVDVVVFEEVAEMRLLTPGSILIVTGEISHDSYNGGVKITASALYDIALARTRFGRALSIQFHANEQHKLPSLRTLLKANPGACAIALHYQNQQASAILNFGEAWCITPTDELILTLRELLGSERVVMQYLDK